MEISKARKEGVVRYNLPRAVRVDPKYSYSSENLHTAVYSSIAIYAETQIQAERLMRDWYKVMQAASKEAKKILEKAQRNETTGTG